MYVGCNRASEPRWSITSSALVLLGLKLPGTSWRRIDNKSVRLFDVVLELQVTLLKHRDWITAWLYFFDIFFWLIIDLMNLCPETCRLKFDLISFLLILPNHQIEIKAISHVIISAPNHANFNFWILRLQVRRMAWIEARKWTLQSYDQKLAGSCGFRNKKMIRKSCSRKRAPKKCRRHKYISRMRLESGTTPCHTRSKRIKTRNRWQKEETP